MGTHEDGWVPLQMKTFKREGSEKRKVDVDTQESSYKKRRSTYAESERPLHKKLLSEENLNQDRYAAEKLAIDKEAELLRRRINDLEEELAGLERAQVFRNTETAMRRERETMETLAQFIHEEGLSKLRWRQNKLAGGVFGAMEHALQQWQDEINKGQG